LVNKRNIITISQLVSGFKLYAMGLVAVIFLAAFAETFGLSLVFPAIAGIVDGGSQWGDLLEYVDIILKPVPADYKLVALLGILSLAFVLKSFLLILHRGMSTHFAMRLREHWTAEILANYLGSEYQQVINQKRGNMIHNVVIEPFRGAKSIIVLLDLASKFVMAFCILVMLIVVDWKATTIISVFSAIIILFIRNTTSKYSLRFGKERLDLHQEASNIAAESIDGIKEIKILGSAERYRFALLNKLVQFTRIQTKFSIFSNLPDYVLEAVIIVIVALVIGYVQLSAALEIKALLPILGFYILVGHRLFKYMSNIITQRMKFTSALPALEMIHSLIYSSLPQERSDEGYIFQQLETDILLDNVSFSYNGSKPVLQDVNLRISRNKMTALVGLSGSGKSTMADLLMGLLKPQSGKIAVNQRDLREFNLASWREKVGYVCQDPFLFNMTLRENILMGKPDATEEEVVGAAKMANIHDFIIGLPEAYDTVVGDRGVKLSGGQRQRIVIARVVIRNPELFIFDEATSALDYESEAAVRRSIEKLAEKKTIIVIAHRDSTIEKADVIFNLDKV